MLWLRHTFVFFAIADKPVQPSVGDIFAVYSNEVHVEGLWYRVQVTKVKEHSVTIEYVDYGDTGEVPITALKTIPQRFLELPFQVNHIGHIGHF